MWILITSTVSVFCKLNVCLSTTHQGEKHDALLELGLIFTQRTLWKTKSGQYISMSSFELYKKYWLHVYFHFTWWAAKHANNKPVLYFK